MTLSRGRNEFVPVSFAKSCKVVVEKGWGMYFHCTHTLFPEGTSVEPFPGFTPEVIAMLAKASNAWNLRGSNPHVRDSGTLTEKTALCPSLLFPFIQSSLFLSISLSSSLFFP